eukprot:CAMPEP_0197926898 /NCGR_PEP_ID=MMETSP1439-20131203/99873_1 /TAXON_ID=66791 /ORGANISM="Gonyaulax spinifera, Strain CCMP409" /LENGTH=185 /DNA_ID=CAMNT_0043549447 /DNA_START=51 /DNA_END=604 /DNA_ORIENTATION=+
MPAQGKDGSVHRRPAVAEGSDVSGHRKRFLFLPSWRLSQPHGSAPDPPSPASSATTDAGDVTQRRSIMNVGEPCFRHKVTARPEQDEGHLDSFKAVELLSKHSGVHNGAAGTKHSASHIQHPPTSFARRFRRLRVVPATEHDSEDGEHDQPTEVDKVQKSNMDGSINETTMSPSSGAVASGRRVG